MTVGKQQDSHLVQVDSEVGAGAVQTWNSITDMVTDTVTANFLLNAKKEKKQNA
jgi:hypothetical protein